MRLFTQDVQHGARAMDQVAAGLQPVTAARDALMATEQAMAAVVAALQAATDPLDAAWGTLDAARRDMANHAAAVPEALDRLSAATATAQADLAAVHAEGATRSDQIPVGMRAQQQLAATATQREAVTRALQGHLAVFRLPAAAEAPEAARSLRSRGDAPRADHGSDGSHPHGGRHACLPTERGPSALPCAAPAIRTIPGRQCPNRRLLPRLQALEGADGSPRRSAAFQPWRGARRPTPPFPRPGSNLYP